MKKNIMNTLLTLLKDHSFKNVNVSMICKAVPISRPIFYKYFHDKEDVIEFFIEQDYINNCMPIYKFHLKEKGTQAFFTHLKKNRKIYLDLYHIDNGIFLTHCLINAYKKGLNYRDTYFEISLHKKGNIEYEVVHAYQCSAIAGIVIY